jgi:hypothetical protein
MNAARGHPGAILGDLEAALRRRGVSGLYGAAAGGYGVLSVGQGLSVWCDGRSLWWICGGERTTWAATDTEGAATELEKLAAA